MQELKINVEWKSSLENATNGETVHFNTKIRFVPFICSWNVT